MPPSVGCCRPLPTYCARLCAWAESTWWEVLTGVANKMQYLRRSWTLPNDSKHSEASFSTVSTDKLYSRVAQMSRSPDLAIFVLTTDRQTTDKTDHITPCACARGNNTCTALFTVGGSGGISCLRPVHWQDPADWTLWQQDLEKCIIQHRVQKWKEKVQQQELQN